MTLEQSRYFERHTFYGPFIQETPLQDTSTFVVIPAHQEPQLNLCLEALQTSYTASDCSIELIMIINHAITASAQIRKINQECFDACNVWSVNRIGKKFQFHPILVELDDKKAGVGLSRKIGMDEAARRAFSINKPQAVISCFDADCTCTPNYFTALHKMFTSDPKLEGCAIYFEHPLKDLNDDARKAIVEYELHLRYFIQAQKWAGYPFAYHTVGSSMAVTAETYIKVGGMNQRQAGEDFYFLHKVIERGNFAELNSATVYPSARESDRVPFGTGRAMREAMLSDNPRLTYNPKSFIDLKAFLKMIPAFFGEDGNTALAEIQNYCGESIASFLKAQDFVKRANECNAHTASASAFTKRLYRWFNAFRLMKYVHYARDHFYENILVANAARWLLNQYSSGKPGTDEDLLWEYRKLGRGL